MLTLAMLIMVAGSLFAIEPSKPEHFALREMLQKKQIEQGLKKAVELADRGDDYGAFMAALLYYGSYGVSPDWPKAIRYFEKLVNKGCADSALMLGVMYTENRNGLPADGRKARTYLEKADAGGVKSAAYTLGLIYYEGMKGIKKDHKKARQCFARSAELGDTDSQYRLSLMLFDGAGGSADPKTGLVWVTRSASAGNANAMFTLGYIHETGKYLPKDLVEAAKNYILSPTQPGSVKSLDRVKKVMTVAQFEEAQRRARAWKKSEPWKADGVSTVAHKSPPASSQQQPRNVPAGKGMAASGASSAPTELDSENIDSWPQPEAIMSTQQIEQFILKEYCAD
jgi:TPR repeat protein